MLMRDRVTGLDWFFIALLVIGGINWGLIGLLNVDLIASIFGRDSLLSSLIYILVGVSAVYVLASLLGRTGADNADRRARHVQ